MRHMRRAINETQAIERLTGPNRGLLRRAWRRFFPVEPPVKMELVWVPAYLVTIALERSSGPPRASCFVEGITGSFAIFEMHKAIADGHPEGEHFPPVLDSAEAERVARESLVTTLLRRSGQARRAIPAATESVELLLWPYWVYYHRRRGGGIDIQILDAATGLRTGYKIKLGLLDAFRTKQREHRPETKGE